MEKRIWLLAILSVILGLGCNVLAQGPVLFDGTNPVALNFQTSAADSALPSDDPIPRSQLMTPDELAKTLQAAKQRLLVLQVGPHTLYAQAHIPGAEFIGATSDNESQEKLRNRVQSLPKNSAIVIYCGCCPWGHCPNIHTAYQLLQSLGFSNVKVLYIADNFGTDWVSKGYPTAKGN